MSAVALTMVLVAVSACTPSSSPRLEWKPIGLAGAYPRTFAVDGERVLVAGERGRYAPAAWTVSGRSATPVTLRPRSSYGPTADLVTATLSGDSVSFVGQRAGGAHGIPRWTIWSGTVSGGVDDLPQTFETFGGPDSLGLVALQTVGGRPLLLGNWASETPEPAFWRSTGSKWVRSATGLRSTGFLASGLGVLGGRPVVLGHSVSGGSLRPTVWLGSADLTTWRAVRLGSEPVAHALDLSCAGAVCLVAVRVPGEGISVWEVDGAARRLGAVKGGRDATWAQVAVGADGTRAVAYGSSTSSAVATWDGDWSYAVPPGDEVRDLAAIPGHLLAISGNGDAEDSPRQLLTA
ncbi:hypothetical protein [Cryptosporangium sp. NPDC048952]|uniref:hypothetical protein n=1 Tax=Cryptosporangium sp. NPDC048952 TaxID=3363961 RepID=UPI0037184374